MILRRLLVFHLIALLMFTNVSIPFFSHTCHTFSKTWTSVFIPAKSCCNKKIKNSVSRPCHTPDNAGDKGICKTPCCESKSELLQLGLDFNQNQPTLSNNLRTAVCEAVCFNVPYSLFHFASESYISIKPHGPSALSQGRTMLISQQVFRC